MGGGEVFIIIVFSIPLIALCYYMIAYPRDSVLWGERWKYQNQYMEPSEDAIKHNRLGGIIGLVIILAFDIYSIVSCFIL